MKFAVKCQLIQRFHNQNSYFIIPIIFKLKDDHFKKNPPVSGRTLKAVGLVQTFHHLSTSSVWLSLAGGVDIGVVAIIGVLSGSVVDSEEVSACISSSSFA